MPTIVEETLPRHFFEGGFTHFTREDDIEGEGTWIVWHSVNGGRICVLTKFPLVYVDPREH
jgi:hypothetical protein